MRWDRFEIFARHKPGVLQLAKLAGQRPVRDAAKISLQLIEPRGFLRQPIDDQELPLTRYRLNQRFNEAIFIRFNRRHDSIPNDRTCRCDLVFLITAQTDGKQ